MKWSKFDDDTFSRNLEHASQIWIRLIYPELDAVNTGPGRPRGPAPSNLTAVCNSKPDTAAGFVLEPTPVLAKAKLASNVYVGCARPSPQLTSLLIG